MDTTQLIILSAIGAYFLIMIIIGLLAGRDQTHHGFVIGSRNVGYIPTIGSLAASFRDGMGIIFWFGFGATVGYGGLWLFLGVVVGLCVYTVIGPRVRRLSREHDFITIGELIKQRFGVVTERFTALLIVIVALMFVAIQLYVSGNLFAGVLGMDAAVGVWTVAAIVGFYLFFGGYSTVVKTDAVQFFLIISLLAAPVFFRPSAEQVLAFDTLFSLSPSMIVGLTGFGFFYVLSSAETWQRVFSARDDKVIRWSFPISGVFLILMTLSLIFLGMAASPYLGSEIDTDRAFYSLFTEDFMPVPLRAFIAVVAMAICMSTLDTFCYLTASTIAKNYLPERVTGKRENYIRLSRVVMVFILVFMSILALTINDVIVFAFDAASLLFVLGPVYIYTALGHPRYKNRRTDLLVTGAVMIASAVYLYMFVNNMFEELILTMVPVGLSLVLVTAAIMLGRKKTAA